MPQDADYSPPLTRSQARLRGGQLLEGIETLKIAKRSESTKGKRQPLREIAIVHNTSKEAQEDGGESEAKKIRISEQEMQMNGAPEGDLFDITVRSDAELLQLPAISDPADTLREVLCRSSEVWADQFNDVETIRRIALQDGSFITSDSQKCVELALIAANSLRSCHIRNGLLCLHNLYSLPGLRDTHPEELPRLLTTLLTKSTTGPRFMMDIASNTLNTVAQAYSMGGLVDALRQHLTHRNAEVSTRSIVLITSAMKKNTQAITTEHLDVLHDCLTNAKRPAARDAVKQCLVFIRTTIGAEPLESLLNKLTPNKIRDLKLELSKSNSSNAGTGKSTSSDFRKAVSSFRKPTLSTKSVPELKITESSS